MLDWHEVIAQKPPPDATDEERHEWWHARWLRGVALEPPSVTDVDVSYRDSAKPPKRTVCPLCNDARCRYPMRGRFTSPPARTVSCAVLAIALAGIATLVLAFAAIALEGS